MNNMSYQVEIITELLIQARHEKDFKLVIQLEKELEKLLD